MAEKLLEVNNCENGEIAIVRNLQDFSESCMEGARRSVQFVDDVAKLQMAIESVDMCALSDKEKAGISNKKDDIRVCKKAIAVAKKQSKLTRETMKVCRDVSKEIGGMKSFFSTIAMATKRYQQGRNKCCKKILGNLVGKPLPCTEVMVKSLEKLQPQWQNLQDEMNELSDSFYNMVEKYEKAKAVFDKKLEEFFKKEKYTTGWGGIINFVAFSLCVVATVVIVSSTMIVGVGAFVAAAGIVAYGVSRAVSEFNKWKSYSDKCEMKKQIAMRQKANCDRVANLARKTREKLGHTADNIQMNVHFFVARLRKCLEEKASTSQYGTMKSGVGQTQGEKTAEDFFEALEYMIEEAEQNEEDFMAGIKATIKACKEVKDTVSCLEDSLLLLDADVEMNRRFRTISNFDKLYATKV